MDAIPDHQVHRQGKAYNGELFSADITRTQTNCTQVFKNDLANIGEIVSLKKLHPKVEFK